MRKVQSSSQSRYKGKETCMKLIISPAWLAQENLRFTIQNCFQVPTCLMMLDDFSDVSINFRLAVLASLGSTCKPVLIDF